MNFNSTNKIALVAVLSDVIQADGIVNYGETHYIEQLYEILDISSTEIKESVSTTLSAATSTLRNLDNDDKLCVLKIIQELSMSDEKLAYEESSLITAILFALAFNKVQLPKARIISIPKSYIDVEKTVLYIETQFDSEINMQISNTHQAMCNLLEQQGFKFFYLPEVIKNIFEKPEAFKSIVQYIDPRISDEDFDLLQHNQSHINTAFFSEIVFLNYLHVQGIQIDKPSFLIKIDSKRNNNFSDFVLLELSHEQHPLDVIQCFFDVMNCLPHFIEQLLKGHEADFQIFNRNSNICVSDEFSYTGFHKMIIDTLLKYQLQKNTQSLFINENGHIFLHDEEGLELKMDALCRSIYILFLLHEEGINLSRLSDFNEELLHIYQITTTYSSDTRLRQTISNVTDFVGNTLNSNLSRIKKTILNMFGEDAGLYIIDGKKGDSKRIALDRRFVIFENRDKFTSN